MKKALIAFMKQPNTKTGMIVVLMFQIIFSVIWMTGYNGVSGRTDQLTIALVNEDTVVGSNIVATLDKTLPFQTTLVESREVALDQLNSRDVHMVVVIPSDFNKNLQSPEGNAALDFTVNESNPVMIKSIMQEVTHRITASVNQGVPGATQPLVNSNITIMNKVDGMANQMVPMMMVLASFVGSMLLSMNLQQASGLIGDSMNKWSKLAARILINLVSALFTGAVGTSLVIAFGGAGNSDFITMWGFQFLFLITFMFFSQVFVLLFGEKGMLLNIVALSVQLVTSGAMVPRELLSRFYLTIGDYLPATYAVEGIMNLRFGGPSVYMDIFALLAIAFTCLIIGICAVWIRKVNKVNIQSNHSKLAA